MTKSATKTSFTDHLKDAKYLFILLIFIIISVIILTLLGNTNYTGLLNFMYYVVFLGGIYILFKAYLKRNN